MSTYVKPKLLIVALEYYPIQNAVTSIIGRFVSLLSGRFDITIATQNSTNGLSEETISGIPVIRTPFHAFSKRENTHNNNVSDLVKMLYFKSLSKYNRDDIGRKDIYYFTSEICKKINIKKYNLILSFSNPFLSHCCASVLAEKFGVPWIAYYFDPFFSYAALDDSNILNRKKAEERVLSIASRILMTYPTNENYERLGIAFQNKIVMAETPGITDSFFFGNNTRGNKESFPTNCKCYFVGNLYKDIRRPDMTIRAFSLLRDSMDLYFVGELYRSFHDDIKSISKNIHFLGKKGKEDIIRIYQEADILVNIGNSIDNQMPSKIFEYISTGKPILNFYKIANCPTLKYLNRYPLALNIFENDLKNDIENNIRKIKDFCLKNKRESIPFSWIKDHYKSNTDEEVATFLGEQIQGVLQENNEKTAYDLL